MTALTPDQKERMKAANSRASKIRTGIVGYLETLAVIAVAYREEDHLALGYDTWDDYVEAEFGADRMRIPMEHRRKAVTELRLAGMSTRQIGDTLGVTRNTVKNDLREVGQVDPPEAVKGRDGKTYSPARSPVAEALEQAIVDAGQRAEDHRGPAPGEADLAGSVPTEDDRRLPSAGSAGTDQGGPVPAPEAHPVDATSGVPGDGADSPSAPAAEAVRPASAAPKWTREEREAHEEEVQVRKDIESAHAFAQNFVTAVRNQCFTILVGYRLGETHLVTAEQIADCRRAIDLLEKEVIADAQR